MADPVQDFSDEFFAEVRARAAGHGQFLETAYLEQFGEWLVESGDFETFDIAQYRAARGMRVDAYGGDPAEFEGVLSLAVADFSPEETVGTLTRTEVEAIFRRLENFLRAALTGAFEQLEESAKGYGLAELIHARRLGINRVRLFILSNRVLSSRYDGTEAGAMEGIPLTYNVWDIGRLQRLVASGQGRENIRVDLEEDFEELLPCLPAHVNGDGYEAYLTVVPGKLLARIYERWGARLLEQNVRSFLQARGKVNGALRGTILNDPGMFFAYNNGITATAEAVETVVRDGVTCLAHITNLQIVNGGQTTASIFSAGKKDKANLDRIFVQMKLSVVEPTRAMEVVPRISEYANSQNRINAADFFANHPFHIRIEEFSRRLWAPAVDGSFKQSKWFYERARGSYADARAFLTPAKKASFDEEYPKTQRFAKTDLAKYEMAWEEVPYVVCKGAQHNFSEYAKLIGRVWKKESASVNELYYRSVIAKAIIFRGLERSISEQQWYRDEGGYRAQLVAYTIAKLDHELRRRGKALNFEVIWRQQAVPAVLAMALTHIAEAIRPIVTRPDSTVANVTEWAKKQACWSRVQGVEVVLPDDLDGLLLDPVEHRSQVKDAKAIQKIDQGIDAQRRVIELGPEHWAGVANYARQRRLLGPTDFGILQAASKPGALPSERQSARLLEILSTVEADGFRGAVVEN